MTRVNCIKQYFSDGSRDVTNAEIMALSKEERQEIGDLCADALDALNLSQLDREWLKADAAKA